MAIKDAIWGVPTASDRDHPQSPRGLTRANSNVHVPEPIDRTLMISLRMKGAPMSDREIREKAVRDVLAGKNDPPKDNRNPITEAIGFIATAGVVHAAEALTGSSHQQKVKVYKEAHTQATNALGKK